MGKICDRFIQEKISFETRNERKIYASNQNKCQQKLRQPQQSYQLQQQLQQKHQQHQPEALKCAADSIKSLTQFSSSLTPPFDDDSWAKK